MQEDNWLNDIINVKWLAFGAIGATAGIMYRAHKGLLKGRWEWLYILFVGAVFAAFFTDPVHEWLQKQIPEIANLSRVRDALAVLIGVFGWFLLNLLIEDGPAFVKRWLAKQVEFAKEETTKQTDNDTEPKV